MRAVLAPASSHNSVRLSLANLNLNANRQPPFCWAAASVDLLQNVNRSARKKHIPFDGGGRRQATHDKQRQAIHTQFSTIEHVMHNNGTIPTTIIPLRQIHKHICLGTEEGYATLAAYILLRNSCHIVTFCFG